jgi:phosphatidylserine decarboxylase
MQFRIHNEGWVYVISSSILTVVCFPFFPILGLILLFISFFIFYFFRDPTRTVPNAEVVLSPADGIITFIGESNLPKECEIKLKYLKISIFLGLFDVHINRIPATGMIKDIKYISGKFINANLDKSSEDNERNIIVIENNKKEKIIVTQIAGLIARRIISDLKINQQVLRGDRFGIIKFGSRVDLYIPKNYNIMVDVGQIMIGGETIISNPNNIQNITKTKKI